MAPHVTTWSRRWPQKAGWYWRRCRYDRNGAARIEWVAGRLPVECEACEWAGPIASPRAGPGLKKKA